jgi:hypothetical protein
MTSSPSPYPILEAYEFALVASRTPAIMGPLHKSLDRAKYTVHRGLSTQANLHHAAKETILALHAVPPLDRTVAATLAAETITDLFNSYIYMYDSVISVRANLKEQLRICDVFLVDAVNYLQLAEDAADRWSSFAAATPRPTGRPRSTAFVVRDPARGDEVRPTQLDLSIAPYLFSSVILRLISDITCQYFHVY